MSPQSQAGGPGTENWIFRSVKQNPEGLLLLAAGCALLMRQGGFSGHSRSDRLRTGAKSGSGAFAQAAEDARQYAGDIAEKTGTAANDFASSASEYAGQARHIVEEKSEQIVQQAQSTLQSTMNRVLQEQPLVVALAGLAVGCAVAAAFPTTNIEKQALGPVGKQVTKAAQEVGRQVSEATAKAGEQLQTFTEERGISQDGLKEVAKEVAGAFSSSMSGETGQAPRSDPTATNRPG
jgi:vacuolar-type H+-ATPase subunit H